MLYTSICIELELNTHRPLEKPVGRSKGQVEELIHLVSLISPGNALLVEFT